VLKGNKRQIRSGIVLKSQTEHNEIKEKLLELPIGFKVPYVIQR
jgi:hypothetical protein